MSRAVYVKCAECQADLGFEGNNADDACALAIHERSRWESLGRWIVETEAAIPLAFSFDEGESLMINGQRIHPRLWLKHAGHQLIVMDEYGRRSDQCDRWAKCPCCETGRRCQRQKGHEGECDGTEKARGT